MKITFEGRTFNEVLDQMTDLLEGLSKKIKAAQPELAPKALVPEALVPEAIAQEAIVPEVMAPVDKPVEKPKVDRVAAMNKARAAKVAKKAAAAASAPEPAPEPFADPADIVKLRQRTIEELQAAYANGRQQEVFALLSVHGNGAKSFRELPVEAFIPIREAIDLGALEGEAPK